MQEKKAEKVTEGGQKMDKHEASRGATAIRISTPWKIMGLDLDSVLTARNDLVA